MADEFGCSGRSDELEVVADCMLVTDPSQKAKPDYTGFVFHRPFFDIQFVWPQISQTLQNNWQFMQNQESAARISYPSP